VLGDLLEHGRDDRLGLVGLEERGAGRASMGTGFGDVATVAQRRDLIVPT
jgi:hypothetical protein